MGKKYNKRDALTRDGGDGSRIYARWLRLRNQAHDPMFDDFKAFYDWSMRNGYTSAAKLVLIDKEQPYSPENCVWQEPQEDRTIRGDEGREWCRKWNETVNRFRVACGMKPFDLEDDAYA